MLALTLSYLQFQLVQVSQKRTLFDKAFPNCNSSASVRALLLWHSNSYSSAHAPAHNFSSFMVPTRTHTLKKLVPSNYFHRRWKYICRELIPQKQFLQCARRLIVDFCTVTYSKVWFNQGFVSERHHCRVSLGIRAG